MRNPLSKKEFTDRQKQVLYLVRKGLTNNEVSKALNISANTVKVHLAKIYKILKVSSRIGVLSKGLAEEDNITKTFSKVKVLVVGKKHFENPEIEKFFFLIIRNLYRFDLFDIQKSILESPDESFVYKIVVAETVGIKPSVCLSLFNQDVMKTLWVYSQNIDDVPDVEIFSSKVSILLYHQLVVLAAQRYDEGDFLQPRWWYVCAFVSCKIDCLSRESFEVCECELQSLLAKSMGNTFVIFLLVRLYYTAIIESWVDLHVFFSKIQRLACSAMRNNPYSVYSQLMMALFNILAGRKNEAITYLLFVVDANPLDLWARRILSQVYLLMGEETKAIDLFNYSERYVPNLTNNLSLIISKSFIFFLLRKYDECEKYALQAIFISPESLYPRLFAMLCYLFRGDIESVEEHKKKLFEYHPNFKILDCVRLLDGAESSRQQVIVALLEKIFRLK